jgi:hypothetical protein
VAGAGYIAVPNALARSPGPRFPDIGSVVLAPREGRRSSETPMKNLEPGAPRVLGSGIELDADLRDRVPLHVAHD